MAVPRKNAQGKWEITVSVGKDAKGRYRYKHITKPTKGEALAAARAIQENETPQTIDALSLTVRETVNRYIARREGTASPSTIANYKKYASSDFQELMPIRLSTLTDEMCQTAIDLYAATHSPKSTQNRWRLIYAALRESKKNINIKVKLPSVKKKRLVMPDEDALKAYLKSIENTPLEIAVLLAAVCGMRRSEICALDFSRDIDYHNNLIHVRQAKVMDSEKHYVIKDPKTEAGDRLIPTPEWVTAKLRKARDNPALRPTLPNSITNQFHRTAPQFGIRCTFHGLRHYYVSVMTALNVPETYQMQRVGHTTNSMLKHYQEYLTHKEVEIDRDMMNYLDAMNPSTEN